MITRADKLGPTFVCPCSSSGKLSDFNVLHIREVTHKGTNDLQVRVLIIAPYANTYRLTSMSRFSSCPSQKRAYARRIKLELLTKYILPYIMRIYVACYAHCSVLLVGTVCVCQISWDGKTDEEKAREGERERGGREKVSTLKDYVIQCINRNEIQYNKLEQGAMAAKSEESPWNKIKLIE